MDNVIGNNIRRCRKMVNLSQEQLAEKLHFTQQQVSYWERGKRLPSIDTLMDIAKALHVSLTDILLHGAVLDWLDRYFDGEWWMYKIDITEQLQRDCRSADNFCRVFAETMLKNGKTYYEVMLTPDEHDIYSGLLNEGLFIGVIPFSEICSRTKWKRLYEQRIQQSVVGVKPDM